MSSAPSDAIPGGGGDAAAAAGSAGSNGSGMIGIGSLAATRSTLSTESPPFNPTKIAASAAPPAPTAAARMLHSPATSSSSSAAVPGMATTAAGSYEAPPLSSKDDRNAGSNNSNAIPKYTFEYEGQTLEIRNVWAENVEEEMAVIRQVIEKYPYVAMDTEFPGVVAKPVTDSYTADYNYRLLKVNVDLLKIIQLGLSFADDQGNFAPVCPCWQFNFKFDLQDDMFAQDSIDLLMKSGISFADHQKHGIDPNLFGELLMVSGLVLDDRVKWVSFHSGYDYGYLLKLLTTTDLPNDEKSFFEILKIYFPTIYDVKYMTSLLDGHHFLGGLQKIADDLGCQRLGAEHQAGSDSLLTMATYFALARAKFSKKSTGKDTSSGETSKDDSSLPNIIIDDSKFTNELFGYGTNHTVRKGAPGPTSSGGLGALVSARQRHRNVINTGSDFTGMLVIPNPDAGVVETTTTVASTTNTITTTTTTTTTSTTSSVTKTSEQDTTVANNDVVDAAATSDATGATAEYNAANTAIMPDLGGSVDTRYDHN